MEPLWDVIEPAAIAVLGIAIRFSLLLMAIALGLALVLPLVYGSEGVRRLWSRIAIQRVAGLRWRARAYYTPAHQWLRERAGRVRVGIDDLAAHLIGRADAVTVPMVGTHLRPGDPLLVLGTAMGPLRVAAPIEGVVKRVNPRILSYPSAITTDPYRRGWLVELSPSNRRYREYMHDGIAREWFAKEAARLSSALEQATGIAAADGGELIVPPQAILDDRQRKALLRDFLEVRSV